MTLLAAALAAAAAYLIATADHAGGLGDRMSAYLMAGSVPPDHPPRRLAPVASRDIGRKVAASGAGAIVGILLGISGPQAPGARSAAGLAIAGAGAGFLAVKVASTQRRESRRRSLHQELPTVADALALHVLAGDSIRTAITRFCDDAGGVAAAELRGALERHEGGDGLADALGDAARGTDHPDAARLYEALAQAHHTGGRLAEGLSALAADFRAAIARDLVAEGGRRALASYGPILALQIPVTLLFLMYPTLVGLGELSATP